MIGGTQSLREEKGEKHKAGDATSNLEGRDQLGCTRDK